MFHGPFGLDGPAPKPFTMADLDAIAAAEFPHNDATDALAYAMGKPRPWPGYNKAADDARAPWLAIDPDTGEMRRGEGMA